MHWIGFDSCQAWKWFQWDRRELPGFVEKARWKNVNRSIKPDPNRSEINSLRDGRTLDYAIRNSNSTRRTWKGGGTQINCFRKARTVRQRFCDYSHCQPSVVHLSLVFSIFRHRSKWSNEQMCKCANVQVSKWTSEESHKRVENGRSPPRWNESLRVLVFLALLAVSDLPANYFFSDVSSNMPLTNLPSLVGGSREFWQEMPARPSAKIGGRCSGNVSSSFRECDWKAVVPDRPEPGLFWGVVVQVSRRGNSCFSAWQALFTFKAAACCCNRDQGQ
jgi:hypothetical protein